MTHFVSNFYRDLYAAWTDEALRERIAHCRATMAVNTATDDGRPGDPFISRGNWTTSSRAEQNNNALRRIIADCEVLLAEREAAR